MYETLDRGPRKTKKTSTATHTKLLFFFSNFREKIIKLILGKIGLQRKKLKNVNLFPFFLLFVVERIRFKQKREIQKRQQKLLRTYREKFLVREIEICFCVESGFSVRGEKGTRRSQEMKLMRKIILKSNTRLD